MKAVFTTVILMALLASNPVWADDSVSVLSGGGGAAFCMDCSSMSASYRVSIEKASIKTENDKIIFEAPILSMSLAGLGECYAQATFDSLPYKLCTALYEVNKLRVELKNDENGQETVKKITDLKEKADSQKKKMIIELGTDDSDEFDFKGCESNKESDLVLISPDCASVNLTSADLTLKD